MMLNSCDVGRWQHLRLCWRITKYTLESGPSQTASQTPQGSRSITLQAVAGHLVNTLNPKP